MKTLAEEYHKLPFMQVVGAGDEFEPTGGGAGPGGGIQPGDFEGVGPDPEEIKKKKKGGDGKPGPPPDEGGKPHPEPGGGAPLPGKAAPQQPAAGRDIDPDKVGLQEAETFAQTGGREQAQRGMVGAILSRKGLFGKPGQNRFQARGPAALPGGAGRGIKKGTGGGGGGWPGAAPFSPSGGLGKPGGIEDLSAQPSAMEQLLKQSF